MGIAALEVGNLYLVARRLWINISMIRSCSEGDATVGGKNIYICKTRNLKSTKVQAKHFIGGALNEILLVSDVQIYVQYRSPVYVY